MFSAASVCVCLFVCQHDNFRTSKHRSMKLGGRYIVQKSRPSSYLGVIAPRGAHSENVALGYDVGKISAGCLVSKSFWNNFIWHVTTIQESTPQRRDPTSDSYTGRMSSRLLLYWQRTMVVNRPQSINHIGNHFKSHDNVTLLKRSSCSQHSADNYAWFINALALILILIITVQLKTQKPNQLTTKQAGSLFLTGAASSHTPISAIYLHGEDRL